MDSRRVSTVDDDDARSNVVSRPGTIVIEVREKVTQAADVLASGRRILRVNLKASTRRRVRLQSMENSRPTELQDSSSSSHDAVRLHLLEHQPWHPPQCIKHGVGDAAASIDDQGVSSRSAMILQPSTLRRRVRIVLDEQFKACRRGHVSWIADESGRSSRLCMLAEKHIEHRQSRKREAADEVPV